MENFTFIIAGMSPPPFCDGEQHITLGVQISDIDFIKLGMQPPQ